MALRKGSPYQIFMRTKLFQMTEMGQLNQIVSMFKLKSPDCKPNLVTGKPLGLNKLVLPFIIAIIGLTISLGILVYETLFWKPINRNYVHKVQRLNDIRNDLFVKTNDLKFAMLDLKKDAPWVDDFMIRLQSENVH
jgi:hypothetical protein